MTAVAVLLTSSNFKLKLTQLLTGRVNHCTSLANLYISSSDFLHLTYLEHIKHKEMEESSQTKPKKSKSRSDKRVAKSARLGGGVEKLKTVVRRLPPNLPEEVFWQSVNPWVTSETTSWKVFYPGKVRKT